MKKLLLLLPFLWACSDRQVAEPGDAAAAQYAYFPLEIGKYVDYQIDSVKYDGETRADSTTTYWRERVADTLRDNAGNLVYSIERAERGDPNQPWVISQVYSAARTTNQAVRTENNLRFLPLIFPMDKRSAWDGNVWIDVNREIEIFGERMRPFTNWAYEVDSIDVLGTVGAFQFDSMLVVTEADDNNVIERRFSRVRYAKGIGLVDKEQWILDSQYCNENPPPTDCETKPWEQKAEKGYILRQRIIGHN
jgi:hypothetical protein